MPPAYLDKIYFGLFQNNHYIHKSHNAVAIIYLPSAENFSIAWYKVKKFPSDLDIYKNTTQIQ